MLVSIEHADGNRDAVTVNHVDIQYRVIEHSFAGRVAAAPRLTSKAPNNCLSLLIASRSLSGLATTEWS
jgi:hypothetical protein